MYLAISTKVQIAPNEDKAMLVAAHLMNNLSEAYPWNKVAVGFEEKINVPNLELAWQVLLLFLLLALSPKALTEPVRKDTGDGQSKS